MELRLYHIAELATLLVIAWRVISAVNLIQFLFKQFPPHVHEADGGIRFPAGFPPGHVEHTPHLGTVHE